MVFVALLNGCSSKPISSSVISANKAQEDAANKLLLLNIARAHERMPMHFSLIGQIRSGPGGWGIGVPALGLQIPFGGAAEPNFALSAALEGQTPVDVTPLTNQEFMRGMTEPMKAEMLGFFVRQGWPAPMLMHLVFEAIEVVRKGAVIERLPNDPRDPSFSKFVAFVNAAATCDIVVAKEEALPELYSTTLTTIGALDASKAKEANLTLVNVDKDGKLVGDQEQSKWVRLGSISQEAVLRLRNRPSPENKADQACITGPAFAPTGEFISEVAHDSKKVSSALNTMRQSLEQSKNRQTNSYSKNSNHTVDVNDEVRFIMRSPQSIIYYLGELSRFQNSVASDGNSFRPVTIPNENGGRSVLFQMSNRGDISLPAVSVDYAGKTFEVSRGTDLPSGLTDRSVSVLSLITLIIGLQDKGLLPPSISNVRLLR